MLGFLFRRLTAILPVLGVVAVVVFLILRLTPGDPAVLIGGDTATDADINQIREKLGLGKPVIAQFGIWVWQVLHGDLGYSYFFNRPVVDLIAQRLEPTLSLAAGTMLLSVALAVPLGSLAAWRMGGWLDRLLSGISVLGFSVPVFVIAYVLIYLFAIKLDWFPVQGYQRLFGPDSRGVLAWARHLVLPWLGLTGIVLALIARVTRASVSEALTEDYIRTARAKGLGGIEVLWRHALPNAAVPVVTVIGIGVALLIGGVVVTETVFSISGLGSLTVDAILSRDFPVIQGMVLMFSVFYVLINMFVDISYLYFDPRIRY